MTYYELNKIEILQRQNQYNQENITKINERLGKIKCECGGYYTINNRERHERTKNHCNMYNYKIV